MRKGFGQRMKKIKFLFVEKKTLWKKKSLILYFSFISNFSHYQTLLTT